MIIGKFKSGSPAGFYGHIATLSFGYLEVAIIPSNKRSEFQVVCVGSGDTGNLQLGIANRRMSNSVKYLDVILMCPTLTKRIRARMNLIPDENGIYYLKWFFGKRGPVTGKDEDDLATEEIK